MLPLFIPFLPVTTQSGHDPRPAIGSLLWGHAQRLLEAAKAAERRSETIADPWEKALAYAQARRDRGVALGMANFRPLTPEEKAAHEEKVKRAIEFWGL